MSRTKQQEDESGHTKSHDSSQSFQNCVSFHICLQLRQPIARRRVFGTVSADFNNLFSSSPEEPVEICIGDSTLRKELQLDSKGWQSAG